MATHDVIIVYKMKDEVSPGVDNISKKTDNLGKSVNKTQEKFNKLNKTNFSSVTGGLMKMAALFAAGLGIREILNTTAEFQKQQSVLNTMFGDQAGPAYFENLKKMSEKLPATMGEVTESFIKLNGIGINASNQELTALADVAAAAGKNVLDAAGALQGAATGEFERLKALNIVTRVNGNKITFMYKNQKTTVANTTNAIKDYMISLGKLPGVAGASDNIMKTMGGTLSNMGDSFSNIAFSIGEALLPMVQQFASAISWVSSIMPSVIGFFQQWGFIIKPVIIALSSFFIVYKIITAVIALKNAMIAFNIVMWANPVVLIIAGIIAAVAAISYAIYKLQENFGGFSNLFSSVFGMIKANFKFVYAIWKTVFFGISYGVEMLGLKIAYFFTGLFGKLKKTFEAIKLLLSGDFGGAKAKWDEKYVNPMEDLMKRRTEANKKQIKESAQDIADAYNEMKDKGGDFINTALGRNKDKKKLKPTVNKPTTDKPVTEKPLAPGVTELSSSSSVKYVNISVNKMIEQFTIQTTNLSESKGKVKEEILTLLRSTIADASSIQN